MLRGRVAEFDEDRGTGVMAAADGARYPFHCTAIGDGTRAIAVEAEAVFRVVPGHSGRWEAAAIVRI